MEAENASARPATTERRAQKSRTREAILAGARDVLARGETVTVQAAAASAGISRATAYRYFSDPAVLAAEAGLAVQVLPFEQIIGGARTTRDKVLAVSLYFFDLAVAHETEFRQFLARNLDAWLAEQGRRSLRGARRVPMFESALADERDRIGESGFRDLVNALTAATGSEAMLALHDIAGVNGPDARRAIEVTAHALLDRYLGPEDP
ncbi:MAG: TetR/AcrR family transcriptional regulator [Pseudooceanicola sp.]